MTPHASDVVELDVADLGPRDGEVVLVVSGLAAQRTWWPPAFVERLARDRRVLLPDNRDNGRSPVLDHLGGAPEDVQRLLAGDRSTPPPYTLAAMAADHVAVLDRLGVDRAHVVGASMGGMLAQHLAFGWPDRVRSLTAIMTTTGRGDVSSPTPEAAATLVGETPLGSVEAYVEASLADRLVVGSPGLHDEAELRERYATEYEVGIQPLGSLRQFLAALADGDRTERLAGVTAPTLVVHGTVDPLIPPAGGRHLAEVVDGARFVAVEGMGHDLPNALLPQVLDPLVAHLDAVEAAERGAG